MNAGAACALVLSIILSGCGSMRPTTLPDAFDCDLLGKYRVSDIYENWRTYRATLSKPLSLEDGNPSFNVLSLSAGGQFGAYGAGFLVGWSKAGASAHPGSRGDIQIVTGVSTGAILATHAFLGFDEEADRRYRDLSSAKVFQTRSLLDYIWANSLMDTSGKDKAISEILSSSIIDEVAKQYGKGRSLYIGTVNLDTGEFVRIDVVKLANEMQPKERRDYCYRAVIGASSAIPIAFSPKFIDGNMWVDGGTRRHLFFTQPPREAMEPKVTRRLYSFVHGDLTVGSEIVKNGVLQIAGRVGNLFVDEGMKDSIRLQEVLASKCPAGMTCGSSGRMFETYYATAAAAAKQCKPKLEECNAGGSPTIDDMFCNAFMICLSNEGRKDGLDYATGARKWLTIDDLCLGTDPICEHPQALRRQMFQ